MCVYTPVMAESFGQEAAKTREEQALSMVGREGFEPSISAVLTVHVWGVRAASLNRAGLPAHTSCDARCFSC